MGTSTEYSVHAEYPALNMNVLQCLTVPALHLVMFISHGVSDNYKKGL